MSKSIGIYILLGSLLAVIGCKQAAKTNSDFFTTNPSLNIPTTDSVHVLSTNHPMKLWGLWLNGSNGYSYLKHDTIRVIDSRGFMTGFTINLQICQSKFRCKIFQYSCTYTHLYKPFKQTLILNKEKYTVGDTIEGELTFAGAYIDTVRHINDTVFAGGRFRYIIKDSGYSYKRLRQDRSYENFMRLAKGRPDTIKEIDLSDLGLKKLPDELKLFINIDSLNLQDNDFNKADLSMLAMFTKLRSITLDRCNMDSLPSSILCHKSLEYLSVFGNNIKHLPDELFELRNLRKLEIGQLNITFLSPKIANLSKLKMLEISGYSLKELPSSIVNLKNLKEFYPPDSLKYLPPVMANKLSPYIMYDNIGNYNEFRNLIPKQN